MPRTCKSHDMPRWCVTLSQVSFHRGTNQLSLIKVSSHIHRPNRKQHPFKHRKRDRRLEKGSRKRNRRILHLSLKDPRIPPHPLYRRRLSMGIHRHQQKKQGVPHQASPTKTQIGTTTTTSIWH